MKRRMGRTAFNFAMTPSGGAASEWVDPLPAGRVDGRDSRFWINDDPERIAEEFTGAGHHPFKTDQVVQSNHFSPFRA